MASLRRCGPLNDLCRKWPLSPSIKLRAYPMRHDLVLPNRPIRHNLALATFSNWSKPCTLRGVVSPLPRPTSLLSQNRAFSDVKPPNVNRVNYVPPKTTIAGAEDTDLHESPYTIPNALTVGRIIACPFLGYHIIQGNLEWATGILLVGGFSDWLDGWIARRWNVKSVLGSILDPAADKALMTTLVGTLAWSGMLPLPLAILIFGRDFALSISAFYFRYISLPQPRTLKRYFDPSIPSAEVKPTQISKVNTALQLSLMGLTLVHPLLPFSTTTGLTALQWTVAVTTIWSGFSYLGKSGVKILKKPGSE